jgi:hypothetical protein
MIVADDKEAVEDTEADRGHVEKIGRNRFPVIHKKPTPALDRLGISGRSLHPAGVRMIPLSRAGAVRRGCGEHPIRVLRHQAVNQTPHFLRQSLPTDRFSRSRQEARVQAKTPDASRRPSSVWTSTRAPRPR